MEVRGGQWSRGEEQAGHVHKRRQPTKITRTASTSFARMHPVAFMRSSHTHTQVTGREEGMGGEKWRTGGQHGSSGGRWSWAEGAWCGRPDRNTVAKAAEQGAEEEGGGQRWQGKSLLGGGVGDIGARRAQHMHGGGSAGGGSEARHTAASQLVHRRLRMGRQVGRHGCLEGDRCGREQGRGRGREGEGWAGREVQRRGRQGGTCVRTELCVRARQ